MKPKPDPLIHIQSPIALRKLLTQSAKKKKCRSQDELIDRLQASFKHEKAFDLLKPILSPRIEKLYLPTRGD